MNYCKKCGAWNTTDSDACSCGGRVFVDPNEGAPNVAIAALEARVAELEAALKPFSHKDLCEALGGNLEGGESIVFQRNHAILKLKHFRLAAALLNKKG